MFQFWTITERAPEDIRKSCLYFLCYRQGKGCFAYASNTYHCHYSTVIFDDRLCYLAEFLFTPIKAINMWGLSPIFLPVVILGYDQWNLLSVVLGDLFKLRCSGKIMQG